MSKGDGYLFASRELREVTEGIRAALSKEVDALDANRVLNTAPADLVARKNTARRFFTSPFRTTPV
jgi:hypothetical protein